MTDKKQVIVFNHIPKTAGMTIRNILSDQYTHIYTQNEPYYERFHRLCFHKHMSNFDNCLIAGHMSWDYRLLRQWSSRHMLFVTMLRDPVSFLKSTYTFGRYNCNGMDCHEWRQKAISFKDWCNTQGNDNYYIRYILSKYEGDITKQDFYEARRRLDEDYILVGITESFEESLYLMYQKLNWSSLPYYPNKINVTVKPPDIESFSDDIGCIEKRNMYSIELYNYFKEKLHDMLNNLSHNSRTELDKYIKTQQDINKGILSFGMIKLNDGLILSAQKKSIGLFLFGSGEGGRWLYNHLHGKSYFNREFRVKGIFDSNISKHGQRFGEATIEPPNEDSVAADDYVVISSLLYHSEMKRQLLALGICEKQIIYPSKLLQELWYKEHIDPSKKENSTQIIETVEQSNTQMVKYYANLILNKVKNSDAINKQLIVAVFADGVQNEFINQALDHMLMTGNISHCTCNLDFENLTADLYIIGTVASNWIGCTDKLLDKKIDVDKILFLL